MNSIRFLIRLVVFDFLLVVHSRPKMYRIFDRFRDITTKTVEKAVLPSLVSFNGPAQTDLFGTAVPKFGDETLDSLGYPMVRNE